MNKLPSILFSFAFLVAAFTNPSPVRANHQGAGYNCKGVVTNFPVTGGALSGNVCAKWFQFKWAVTGHTTAPKSHIISTWVGGYETCSNTRTLTIDAGYRNSYNTTNGPGHVKDAFFMNCQQWQKHGYAVSGSFYRKKTSSSNWEGTSGTGCY